MQGANLPAEPVQVEDGALVTLFNYIYYRERYISSAILFPGIHFPFHVLPTSWTSKDHQEALVVDMDDEPILVQAWDTSIHENHTCKNFTCNFHNVRWPG